MTQIGTAPSGGLPAVSAGAIQSSLGDLNSKLSYISLQLGSLEKQFSPVLREIPPCPIGGSASRAESDVPLVRTIEDLLLLASEISDKIQAIKSRADI